VIHATAIERAFMEDARLSKAVDEVARDWKRAAYYDDAESAIEQQWKTMIWPKIRHCSFDVVVDLAAGHGRNSRKLLEHTRKLFIVDVNEENVAFCRRRFADQPAVTVLRNNGYSLRPIEDQAVTLLYCFDAMVHFDSDVVRNYLTDIFRVLRPGGHAFLHHSNMSANPTGSHRDTPGWRHFMTRELMAHWAHKAGFVIESQQVFDWRPGISDCFTILCRDT
jgi:ubiquinone/menaquinone biosynthesis C-methylase UbiE